MSSHLRLLSLNCMVLMTYLIKYTSSSITFDTCGGKKLKFSRHIFSLLTMDILKGATDERKGSYSNYGFLTVFPGWN